MNRQNTCTCMVGGCLQRKQCCAKMRPGTDPEKQEKVSLLHAASASIFMKEEQC